jgi:threonine/homoserine/homoserine lactone efflux protein
MHSIAVSLIAYTAAATVLTITPGLDTALVVRTATTEGAQRALWSGLGVVTGCFIWTTIVAGGLGVLLVASQLAYTVLRWIGAAYLLYVGFQLLRNPRTRFADEPTGKKRSGSAFARGALTNLLNPKVGIFYLSFLPQFIPNNVPVAAYTVLLGAIHAVLGSIWFICLIAATRPLIGLLRRRTVMKTLDRITGGIFIAFGMRLAVASNAR